MNSILKVAVSFKIIITTSVTRSCFTKQHQNCKTKTKTTACKTKTNFFWSQTGLVLRPTVSDHITVVYSTDLYHSVIWKMITAGTFWRLKLPSYPVLHFLGQPGSEHSHHYIKYGSSVVVMESFESPWHGILQLAISS